MKKYDGELKARALERIKEVGIKKTGEELGITVQTLYKWRNSERADARRTDQGMGLHGEALLRALKDDDSLEAKVIRLEEENAELRERIARLRKAFIAMFE